MNLKFLDNKKREDVYYEECSNYYEFLVRSDSEDAIEVCYNIDRWLNHYPNNEINEWLQRFKNDNYSSCFTELYLYILFRELGYKIEIHPDIDFSSKKPDFLLKNRNELFYVEVITTKGLSMGKEKQRRMIDEMKSYINKNLDLRCFFIGCEIYEYPKNQLKFSKILKFLEKWIGDEKNITELEKKYTNDEWEIEFELIPKKRRGQCREPIQMQTNPTERLNFSNIGRALLKKCSKYGSLNKPYIIAINIINSYFRVDSKHDNMLDLLLGKTEYIYDPNTKTETPTRKMDGTWRSKNGPRYKRNSGILALERLYVHNFNKCKKIYYPNPWAKNVYHGKLENIDHYKVDDGKYIFESGDKFPNL